MVKALLCIIAAYRDRIWTGFWVGGVSDLTLQLIRFNGQVSPEYISAAQSLTKRMSG